MTARPIIALIGRPNVGKSTLFNRLVGARQAIISPLPRTTRDRHFGLLTWHGTTWTAVDTAGLILDREKPASPLSRAIDEQITLAVAEADLLGLVVDAQAGVDADDQRIIARLRREAKPLVVLANKADNPDLHLAAANLKSLGIGPVFAVSAIHGRGLGDFLEYLTGHFPGAREQIGRGLPRISFVGRPNVGKSTLINRILGQRRLVVSPTPGTTRDSIASLVKDDKAQFYAVDTAGIRRRGRITPGIEKGAVFRALRAINQSTVVVLVITLEESISRGDAHIAEYALELGKPVIVAITKSDRLAHPPFQLPKAQQEALARQFLQRFPFLTKLPAFFVSGLTGEGIDHLLFKLGEVAPRYSGEAIGEPKGDEAELA